MCIRDRTGLEALLIQNSLAHFCAVAALTLCAALVLDALRPLRPAPGGRAWKELDLDALRHNARTCLLYTSSRRAMRRHWPCGKTRLWTRSPPPACGAVWIRNMVCKKEKGEIQK